MILNGKNDQLEREHNERAWLAWHIAALGRQNKLPKLETLMHRTRKARAQKQTPEQMLGIVKMLNAAFGGRVIDKAKR